MTTVRVFTWQPAAPAVVLCDTREVADVAAYLDSNHQAGQEWGISYAAYDAGVRPWRLLRFYDAATGETGTRCECPGRYEPPF